MKIYSSELFLQQLCCDVYPITIIKFLLNKKKIIDIYEKIDNKNQLYNYNIDNSNCNECKKRNEILCRNHTSINRIIKADNILYDKSSNFFFYKNEIFKFKDNKLFIIYCPHTKLIQGNITKSKVKKFSIIIVDNINEIDWKKNISKIISICSSELTLKYLSCWFNKEFSIVTIPNENKDYSSFFLIPNN